MSGKLISFCCPFCDRETKIREETQPFGKKKKCKGCKEVFRLSKDTLVKFDQTGSLEEEKLKISEVLTPSQLIEGNKEELGSLFERNEIQEIKGKSFDRYMIVKEIGRGGMGKVYKAHDPKLNRFVALKRLIYGEEASSKEKKRFLREAKITAQLRHPNIVTMYDMGESEGEIFFTMDFIEGHSLREALKKDRLSIDEIVKIIIKVGSAISYAHSLGIIHRDLNPANIVMENGEPKVMDFGLAKLVETSHNLSKSGTMLGTLKYMPPEQVEGKLKEIDKQSDVYALGATLYEALAKIPPFMGKTKENVIYKILNEDPKSITKIKKNVHESLSIICLKALEKKKEHRYQSAERFVNDLSKFTRGEAIEARSLGILGQLSRKLKRHKTTSLLFLTIFLIFFGAFFGIERKETNLKKYKEKIEKKETNLKEFRKYRDRGLSFFELREYEKAIASFSKAIELEPEDAFAYYKRGIIYTHLTKNKQAVADFNKVIALDPKHILAYRYRGLAYINLQKHEKAIIDFIKVMEFQPKDKITYHYWTMAYKNLKDKSKSKAIVELTRLIVSNPKNSLAYYYRGWAYSDLKKYQAAIVDFTKAIELNPEDRTLYHYRAQAYDNLKQYQKAAADYTKTIELNPWNSNLYLARGSVYARLKEYEKAIADYTKLIERSPKNQLAYRYRAWVYNDAKQYRKAIADFTKAIELNSKDYEAYHDRGVAHAFLKEYKEAMANFTKTIELAPKNITAYENRASVYTFFGQHEKAQQDVEKAKSLKQQ